MLLLLTIPVTVAGVVKGKYSIPDPISGLQTYFAIVLQNHHSFTTDQCVRDGKESLAGDITVHS